MALVLTPSVALAAAFQSEDRLVLSIPLLDDLYAAGGQVLIESPIEGDLTVVGGEIDIRAAVKNDIAAAGGRIIIHDAVGDDVRVVGGEVDIHGTIEDDLIIAGGTVQLFDTAIVKGDVIAAGGEVRLAGTIEGNLKVVGGRIVVDAAIAQSAEVRGDVAEINNMIGGRAKLAAYELYLNPGASFASSVTYWTQTDTIDFGDTEATFDSSLGEGYEDIDSFAKTFAVFATGFFFFSGLLVVLILSFAKKWFHKTATTMQTKQWKSFGYGILFLIGVPVIAALLFASVAGIPLAILLLTLYAFALYFAPATTALVFTSLWEHHKKTKWTIMKYAGAATLVYTLILLITFIPIVGCIAVGIAYVFALGALLIEKLTVVKDVIK